jgi:hypothetical protein
MFSGHGGTRELRKVKAIDSLPVKGSATTRNALGARGFLRTMTNNQPPRAEGDEC